MKWLRAHPYLTALIGAALLIVTGAYIVANRSAVEPESGVRVWGGTGVNFFGSASDAGNNIPSNREGLYSEILSGPPFYYGSTNTQIPSQIESVNDFDFNEFLAMLSSSGGASTNTKPNGEGSAGDPYSFIPSGLISISAHTKERTPSEQALFNYGNEVGSYIESHERTYRNAPQILKDQFEDRDNPTKNAVLLELAESLAGVGTSLERIGEVPSPVTSINARLATSYQEMGEMLAKVPDAKGDQEMIDAMLAYNAKVEAFTKNFVALATLFSAYGVEFTPEDPGSVFTFTQASF